VCGDLNRWSQVRASTESLLALVDATSDAGATSWASALMELFIGVLSYVVKIIRHIFTRKWAVVSIVKLVALV